MMLIMLFILININLIIGVRSEYYLITDYILGSQDTWIDFIFFPYRLYQFWQAKQGENAD